MTSREDHSNPAGQGEMLRILREARGVSLAQLAHMTHYHKSYLGYIETGTRRATSVVIRAYEQALQVEIPTMEVDEVQRRALLLALAAGIASPSLLAEALRQQMLSRLDKDASVADWGEVSSEYGRRFMNTDLEVLKTNLAGDLLQVQGVLNTPQIAANAAKMSTIFGMIIASTGDPNEAIRWYRTAIALADQSGDTATRVWTRGRGALTMGYEGADLSRVISLANDAIALSSRPSTGSLEALVALAQAKASLGQEAEARALLGKALDMFPTVDKSSGSPTIFSVPEWRMAMSTSLVFCRVGDPVRALAAQDESTRLRPDGLIRFATHIELHRAILEHDVNYAKSVLSSVPAGHVSMPVRQLALEAGVPVKLVESSLGA